MGSTEKKRAETEDDIQSLKRYFLLQIPWLATMLSRRFLTREEIKDKLVPNFPFLNKFQPPPKIFMRLAPLVHIFLTTSETGTILRA